VTLTVDDFVYDPFAREVMANPLPFYEVLRERHPVYYVEKYDTFFLSRFSDAWDFLSFNDNEFVSTEGSVFAPGDVAHRNEGALPDPPTTPLGSHLRHGSPTYEVVRQGHGKPLRPGSVRKLEGFIRQTVGERLDALLPLGRFNLSHEFGGIVAASTICHLFGIPVDLAEDLLDTVNAMSRTDHDEPGFSRDPAVYAKLRGFLLPQIAARRAAGADGSSPAVDGMINLRLEGRELTDEEIAVNLLCVQAGGTETVPKILAHGLMELWRHPDQLAAVRADPAANSAAAVEEMIRYCGPAQWFARTCRKESVVAGQLVRPGQRVAYLTQSANRDPREFGDDAGEFRWDRPIPRTLGFGRGQHFCIGVHVARLELRIMLEVFLTRVRHFEIDVEGAVRAPSSFQWGYGVIPVVVRELAGGTTA
jgi:cytochrome P450